MIVRTWRTRIDLERLEEFQRFVRERSLPMFREQPELVGSGMLVGDQRTEAFVVEDSEGIF